jgi:phosphoglycolate phosphatase
VGIPLLEAIELRSPGVDVQKFHKAFQSTFPKAAKSGKLDQVSAKNLRILDELISCGKTLLVLTSRSIVEAEHVMSPSHPLYNRIETFYYKENMKYHKPDPRAFEHIEHEHGWRPSECVYVGDTLTDAESATKAGLYFIASLESGLRNREDFNQYRVDAFIDEFTELPRAISHIEAKNEQF